MSLLFLSKSNLLALGFDLVFSENLKFNNYTRINKKALELQ